MISCWLVFFLVIVIGLLVGCLVKILSCCNVLGLLRLGVMFVCGFVLLIKVLCLELVLLLELKFFGFLELMFFGGR